MDSRTISYLEPSLRSLQCFDSLSNDYCLKLLEDVVNNPIKVIEVTTNLITAWKQQDLPTIDNILNSYLSEHFDLFSDIILRRNEEWLQKLINETLPDETPKLIVVGMLHCAGERGITSLMLDHNIQTTILSTKY
ncbi:TraB/GumN family protein [bacterium]|nr:TraB/GumN family protein [bacterium]